MPPSATSLPLVSVLMPAYNHEKYVEESVRSIWAQTYPNVELIVIDDGSRDATPDILRRLAAESPIPMRVEVQTNVGPSETMNRAFALARGEYITLTASDDRHLPHHVETLMDAFRRASPDTGVVFGDMYLIDESGRRIDHYLRMQPARDGWIYEDLLLRRFMVPALACMIPAAVFREIGGYPTYSSVCDLEILMRIARTRPFVQVHQCVAEYRGSHAGPQMTKQIDKLVPDFCRLFEEGMAAYPKAKRPLWKRYAYGLHYSRIGQYYYTVRDLASARRWLLRSIAANPFHTRPWNFLLRSLLGPRVLDAISGMKARVLRRL
jgi:alpha-1,3-rhamnosyltransferase